MRRYRGRPAVHSAKDRSSMSDGAVDDLVLQDKSIGGGMMLTSSYVLSDLSTLSPLDEG